MEQPRRFTAMTGIGKIRIDVNRFGGGGEYVTELSLGSYFSATDAGSTPAEIRASEVVKITGQTVEEVIARSKRYLEGLGLDAKIIDDDSED
jgi:hypothetical protein